MSGSIRDAIALRRAIEAEARLAEEQRLGGVPAPGALRPWTVTLLPHTVEPRQFRDGLDLAAMARVEGWR